MIGDIGWTNFYHLGDEAMTEFALEALHARGASHVTLIAGNPSHAAELYGVDTLPRIGFTPGRPANRRRRDQVLATASGATDALPAHDPAHAIITAVRDADAVLIAGGGNLNSMFAHHLYERSTLAALARLFGKPYALTSQTVGPLVYDDDRDLLDELFTHAQLVGCREAHTLALVADLTAGRARTAPQMDDAYSLAAGPDDHRAVEAYAREPFILASFAERGSSPTLTDHRYRTTLIDATREIADRTGMPVLLAPHGGALPPAPETRDQHTDRVIAEAVSRPGVTPLPMLTARQVVALTSAASAVFGTRYHAGIFAAAAGVPSVSLAPNLYSSVRMRGAAANVGMQEFVLPFHAPARIVNTVVGAADDTETRSALTRTASVRHVEHRAWWDFVIASMMEAPTHTDTEDSTAPAHMAAPVIANRHIDDVEVAHAQLDTVEDVGRVSAQYDRRAVLADRDRHILRARVEELEAHKARLLPEKSEAPSALEQRVTDLERQTARLRTLSAQLGKVERTVSRAARSTLRRVLAR
ncbi:hypothetical protein GCM10023159_29880 [Brevibacterium yomogidense]